MINVFPSFVAYYVFRMKCILHGRLSSFACIHTKPIAVEPSESCVWSTGESF